MGSPSFSEFRELMDKWDKASKLFEENDLCLFFKKDGIIYGATEPSRITYARMKNPESKEDKSWKKEASFTAYDLEKTDGDNEVKRPFGYSDINNIKLISQEQAEKELKKQGKTIPVISEDDDQTYGEE